MFRRSGYRFADQEHAPLKVRRKASIMCSAKGVREVGHVDCAGGGQIVVEKGIAYVGHMESPHGSSIFDVRDPKNPRRLAEITMPPGTHSHKARVANGV